MIDLAGHIAPGSGVWWGQAGAEPTPLVHALLDQIGALAGDGGTLRAFCGLTWDRRLTREPPAALSLVSYGALGELRRLSAAGGRLEIVPCHFSALPRLFAEGDLPHDAGLVQVSPPDSGGMCSLGIGADYAADAIEHTPVLIAEINHRMPRTAGTSAIALSRFAASVETDRPLGEGPPGPPTRSIWPSPATSPRWSRTAPRSSSGSARCPPPSWPSWTATAISASTRG